MLSPEHLTHNPSVTSSKHRFIEEKSYHTTLCHSISLKITHLGHYNVYINVEKAKGGKRRDIPLNSELTKFLRFSIKKPNGEYIFCDENDEPFRNIDGSCGESTALKFLVK